MKWSVGGVYGHYDVNVFCGQGMENHLSKVQRSILHRPSAVVDVEILSNPFLEMGRVCFNIVPDLAKNVRSLAEKR